MMFSSIHISAPEHLISNFDDLKIWYVMVYGHILYLKLLVKIFLSYIFVYIFHPVTHVYLTAVFCNNSSLQAKMLLQITDRQVSKEDRNILVSTLQLLYNIAKQVNCLKYLRQHTKIKPHFMKLLWIKIMQVKIKYIPP